MAIDRQQIEALARECIAEDWDDHLPGYYRDMDIKRFASLVRAAALEEAAQICEKPITAMYLSGVRFTRTVSANECATVIRALIRQPTG